MGNIFIGLMTGTSADSLDLAAVDFSENNFEVIGLKNYEIPHQIKEEILKNTRDKILNKSSIENLDIKLGHFFTDKIEQFLKSLAIDSNQVEAIGSHGQTIKHEPNSKIPYSLQIGSPQIISNMLGVKTIGNFRDDDIEAGGQGAPLSPLFHREVFSEKNDERIIVNIGGITNLSLLGKSRLIGFDTGPGNCLMDSWTKINKKGNYDHKGNWAKSGNINKNLIEIMMSDDYFALDHPKSTGPDYFSLDWIYKSLQDLEHEIESADVQATVAELTVISLCNSIEKLDALTEKVYFCGGGVHNEYLMSRISTKLDKNCLTTRELGVDPDYLEAICFAWLAYKRVSGIKFDMRQITGSKKKVYLGKVYVPVI